MSSEGSIPKALTADELKRLVFEAISKHADTDNPETSHALLHHLERGIQTDDVLFALKGPWKKFKPLPFNRKFWQWKYKIWANNLDDEELTIVIAVDTVNREFEVITRWANEDEDSDTA